MNTLSPVFARIVKVDEATRSVTGRATQEMVDRDNEVFDYATSKPNFMKWSAEVFADTDGKSMGNVRAMHGNVAAGILTNIDFDDVERAIDVTAHITDDQEWRKITSGTYSGFSIGGKYTKKWPDIMSGKMVNRYTAAPSEISIVDRPCVPAAKFFTVHKRDGSTEQVAFAAGLMLPADELLKGDDPARDEKGQFSASAAGGKAAEHEHMSGLHQRAAALSTTDAIRGQHMAASKAHDKAAGAYREAAEFLGAGLHDTGKGRMEDGAKFGATAAAKTQGLRKADSGDLAKDGGGFTPPPGPTTGLAVYDLETGKPKPAAKGLPREQDANADDAIATDPNGGFGGKADDAEKRAFSDKERAALADTGAALPDGSFPIKSRQDVENAVQAHGRAKDPDQAKAHIKARAAALGATDALPAEWNKTEGMDMSKVVVAQLDDTALADFLVKNHDGVVSVLEAAPQFEFKAVTFDVGALVNVVGQLKKLAGGDDTPAAVKTAAVDVLEKIGHAGDPVLVIDSAYSPNCAALAAIAVLRKSWEPDDLAKRGARNSAADSQIIQGVHDSICKLGAACATPSPHSADGVAVGNLPVGSTANKADGQGKETADMTTKVTKDAVSSEGNSRGAVVSSPSMPKESSNANNDSVTADDGATKGKARPSWMDDAEGDDDSTKANKAKARSLFGKDDMAMAAKADGTLSITPAQLSDMMSKAVQSGVTAALGARPAHNDGSTQVGGVEVIPRVAPALMVVGKDGSLSKHEAAGDADALKKMVSKHPADVQKRFAAAGDDETTTLIKSIHANRIMVPPEELQVLGYPGNR